MSATRSEVPESAVVDFAPSYSDCFRVGALPGFSAAEWAAATLRGADGAFSRVVWQGILGFRLAPATPGTLVGWPIVHDSPQRFVMEADGPVMAGRMVFELADDEVRWTTSLRHHRSVGRIIWAAAGPGHRRIAPRVLGQAHRSLARVSPTL